MTERSPIRPARVSGVRGRYSPAVLAVLGLVLLSFLLRTHRLDAHSLWGDEIWSYHHTSHDSIGAVLESVREDGVHPPLYYLILHPWMAIAGQSEYALRYPSALLGTLGVVAIYVLGRRLGGTGVGLIAAALHALSPIHVYYSQEARMYSLVVLSVVLSSDFFWRLLRSGAAWPWRSWVGYVICSALAVNVHLFAVPVLAAHAFVWVVQLLWKRSGGWTPAVRCATAQLVTALLFVPWLVFVWDRTMQLSAHLPRMSVELGLILPRCLSDFSAGVPVLTGDAVDLARPALIPYLVLIVLAFAWPRRRGVAAFLGSCIASVVVGVYYISFPTLPGWTRFFLAASPFYHLLLALGAGGMGRLGQAVPRRWGRIGRALLPGLMILPLLVVRTGLIRDYYTDPLYARWDYRGQMATIVQDLEEGAAVVLQGRSLVFEYYFASDRSYLEVPAGCGRDDGGIDDETAAVAAGHEAVWLVRAGPTPCDPNLRAEQWLKEHAFRVGETWLEDNLYGLYLTPATMSDYLPPAEPEQVTFEDLFELDAFALDRGWMEPGDALAVGLRWRVLATMETDYKFFLVLVGPDGAVHAQRDGMPLNWLWPTRLWQAGETVDDRWGMALPDDAPKGGYTLHVGAYDPMTGRRLSTRASDGSVVGDMVWVAGIEVR